MSETTWFAEEAIETATGLRVVSIKRTDGPHSGRTIAAVHQWTDFTAEEVDEVVGIILQAPRLEADNKRLREALEVIKRGDRPKGTWDWQEIVRAYEEEAHIALAATEPSQDAEEGGA